MITQGENSCQNSTNESVVQETEELFRTLNATKDQLEVLSKQYSELEAKSKADVKVLVKEVKSLRNSQSELKRELSESMKEKCEAEVYYHLYVYLLRVISFQYAIHILCKPSCCIYIFCV